MHCIIQHVCSARQHISKLPCRKLQFLPDRAAANLDRCLIGLLTVSNPCYQDALGRIRGLPHRRPGTAALPAHPPACKLFAHVQIMIDRKEMSS